MARPDTRWTLTDSPNDICACGHRRSQHVLDEVQRFTDGSVRRRLCAGSVDRLSATALPCMCDQFMQPLDVETSGYCGYCGHESYRHAYDGCHATDEYAPWRPGPARCNCDHYPGQPSFRRWKAHIMTALHGQCARAGRCLEHEARPSVESCS